LLFGQKAKQIRQNVIVNQIVQESPEQIAKKIIDLNTQISNLQTQLAAKDQLLEQLKDDNEDFVAVGSLRSEIELLNSKIDDKNLDILHLNLENEKER